MLTSKRSLLFVSVMMLAPVALVAQDPAKFDADHYKVLIDNSSVRVLKVNFAVGGKSPMHEHPDGILVSLSPSKVRFTMADGATVKDQDMAKETAMYTLAGKHMSANIGPAPVDAILVEFKALAAGKAPLPTNRPGLTQTVLAEGPRGAAYRVTVSPTFAESPGTTHEYDQVIIALGAAQMPLSIQGKLEKTNWVRGDVAYVRRGAQHAAQNTGGKTIEFVTVAIK